MANTEVLARHFDPDYNSGANAEPDNSWTAKAVRQFEPITHALKNIAATDEFQGISMMAFPVVVGAVTHSAGAAKAAKQIEKDLAAPAIFRSVENGSHHGGPGVKVYPLEAFSDAKVAAKYVPANVAGDAPKTAVVFGGGGNAMYAHAGVTDYLESKGLMDASTRTIGVSAGSTHTALHMSGVPFAERLGLVNETFDIKRHNDMLELMWQFHPMKSQIGNGITDALPRTGPWPFGVWDGQPIDTLPQWQKLVQKLDLQRRIDSNHSFIAYDPRQKVVVEFRGGPGEYDVARALAASTAFNIEGMGIKPVETIIHGRTYNLIDFGMLHNHPTRPLIAENKPAIVSSLYQRGNNREQDTIIHALKENRLPFDRVSELDAQKLYRDGYTAAENALTPRIESSTTVPKGLLRSLIRPLKPLLPW